MSHDDCPVGDVVVSLAHPDRRVLLQSLAGIIAAKVLPASTGTMPSLERWIGPQGMFAIAAIPGLVDAAGTLALSSEARADLTAFVVADRADIAVRLAGAADAAVLRAILLHGPGFPGHAVRVAPIRQGMRHLAKMAM